MVSVDNEAVCSIRRVAIVEGDGFEASFHAWETDLLEFDVVRVPAKLKTVEAVVDFIQMHADAAICLHRLASPDASLISFCGAELVAALYAAKIPALLLTQYAAIDQHTSLRKWRDQVPVVLQPRELALSMLREYFSLCSTELNGDVPAARLPYRVMLQVKQTENALTEQCVDVTIPYWDETQIVRFPLALIPENLHDRVMRGAWLFADVNIRAALAQDLYLRRFELAPEPAFDEHLLYCLDAHEQSDRSTPGSHNDMGFFELWI